MKIMNRTVRLNKIQKYAINWLNKIGKNNEEIAKELKVKQEVIENYVRKNIDTDIQDIKNSTNNKKEYIARFKDTENNKSHTLNMMVTQTAGKNQNSVCIMTKEASSLSDKR